MYDENNIYEQYKFWTHTHTHTHIYIYIYMCVCVCVCVCDRKLLGMEHRRLKQIMGNIYHVISERNACMLNILANTDIFS